MKVANLLLLLAITCGACAVAVSPVSEEDGISVQEHEFAKQFMKSVVEYCILILSFH